MRRKKVRTGWIRTFLNDVLYVTLLHNDLLALDDEGTLQSTQVSSLLANEATVERVHINRLAVASDLLDGSNLLVGTADDHADGLRLLTAAVDSTHGEDTASTYTRQLNAGLSGATGKLAVNIVVVLLHASTATGEGDVVDQQTEDILRDVTDSEELRTLGQAV